MKRRNKLILEFTEFNANRLSPDSAQMSVHVDNPQLSVNAFDRHEDAIRAATSKLNTLMHSMSNTSQFNTLRSKIALENQNIQSMKILRIVKADNVRYNVYVSFVIQDQEYWGEIKDILGQDTTINSEVFKDTDLVLTKDWVIKMQGIIIKIIKKWLIPENGFYRNLNEETYCFNRINGMLQKLAKDTEVEVVRSYDNKITIKYKNEYYDLVGDSFIYFNYWFVKLPTKL